MVNDMKGPEAMKKIDDEIIAALSKELLRLPVYRGIDREFTTDYGSTK